MEFQHQTVLLKETIDLLEIKPEGIYIDCTAGGGGHSREILRRLGPEGRLIALDQDPMALEAAHCALEAVGGNFVLVRSNFSRLEEVLGDLGIGAVDGLVFDLGVSSPQLDRGERGFSYQQDALLDMRMDPDGVLTALEIVNEWPVERIEQVIWDYGEERWARRIAQFIAEKRSQSPIRTTGELVDIIKGAIPAAARREGPHPAKRTFQALRIAVNRELEVLESGIRAGIRLLRPQGRICVISFHSLEDRIVKNAFQEAARACRCPADWPVCRCEGKAQVKILTRKAITPSEEELENNPRSRSAKLRGAVKL